MKWENRLYEFAGVLTGLILLGFTGCISHSRPEEQVFIQGTQGICPTGWHVPSDEELKILEGAIDSQYGLDNPIWNDEGSRGYDVGLVLKSIYGCYNGNNGTDTYGFRGLPAGSRYHDGGFNDIGSMGLFWSSDMSYTSYLAWYRALECARSDIYRHYHYLTCGYSVRCIRDY
jgi:uncharacterized protein (TIGR02145 family)